MADVIPIRGTVLHEQVARKLRAMLVEGRIAAGAKLNERELSEKLQVSRTPLREAIRQLAAEGLVVLPNNGQLRQGAARYLMVLAQKFVRRDMLVRIIKTPGGIIDGFDVGRFKVGSVYDLPISLASVLILDGYGISEMRDATHASTDRGKRERSSDKPQDGRPKT